MYKKLNITENHLQVLSLFTKGFDKEYYIREVQKILKISPRTAQIILNDLENKTILESSVKGKIKTYKIKKNYVAEEYMVLAEHYKKIVFLETHELIREVLAKITPLIKGLGLVFGSYAKALEKEESDLDIFVAGSYDKKSVKKISKTYGIEISIKSYPLNIFEENIKNDILVKEVLKDHITFLNAEEFVKMVLKNR